MYERFYGLSSRPFRNCSDNGCFFLSASHKQALIKLRDGLEYGGGFVLLTGAHGIGKSSLVNFFISDPFFQTYRIARINGQLKDDLDLLPQILASFHCNIDNYNLVKLIAQLEAFLIEQSHIGKRCLLVIDEAQSLSHRCLEVLRLLTNLQANKQPVLQILLIGDAVFKTQLKNDSNTMLRKRIVMDHEISAMELADTKHYIEYHLKQVGWNGDPKLNDEVFVNIQQLTMGVPSEINRYLDRLLKMGMQQKIHNFSSNDVRHLLLEEGVSLKTHVDALPIQSKREAITVKSIENKQEQILKCISHKKQWAAEKSVADKVAVDDSMKQRQQHSENLDNIPVMQTAVKQKTTAAPAPEVKPTKPEQKITERASVEQVTAKVTESTVEAAEPVVESPDILGAGSLKDTVKAFESGKPESQSGASQAVENAKPYSAAHVAFSSYLLSIVVAFVLFYFGVEIPNINFEKFTEKSPATTEMSLIISPLKKVE